MDDGATLGHGSTRREPAWFTLADLSVAVLGCALVLCLPRLHHLADRIAIDNVNMPRWVAWLYVVREFAMKGALIVGLVVVARRARYGALPKPADWLALLVGLPVLHEIIGRLQWSKRFARWYLVDFRPSLGLNVYFDDRFDGRRSEQGDIVWAGSPYKGFPADFTPGDEHTLWGILAAVVLAAMLTTLVLAWRRIPCAWKTILLTASAFAWIGGIALPFMLATVRVVLASAERFNLHPDVVNHLAWSLVGLPTGILFGVPIVASYLALRGALKNWAWTSWAGMMFAMLALPGQWVVAAYAFSMSTAPGVGMTRLTIMCFKFIIEGLVSWLIVRWMQRRTA